MGLSERLAGRRVYVDANVIIHFVERVGIPRPALDELSLSLTEAAFKAVTSELSLCETLVKPFQRQDEQEIARYRSLLESSGVFALVPVTRATQVEAARLRAVLQLRTPDAIHVATALAAGCQVFLSNDQRLRLPPGIEHVRLS